MSIMDFIRRKPKQPASNPAVDILEQLKDKSSIVHKVFLTAVNAEVNRVVRSFYDAKRIAHCPVCLTTEQLIKVDGRYVCKTHGRRPS